ncbi:hypothetical protein ACFSVK_08000 [Azorhizophilus paspali]|uniref:hypothetical protein n=1 Tax=Azorhizophilus paspali TaxID=69963 RepID=UPI00363AD1D5
MESVRNAIPAILLFGLFALLSACTRIPVLPAETASLPERVELTGVPFYPQSDYQGGPAALTSMLNQRGLETSPGLLRAQLQHLDREDAMATELEAAARRLGMQVFPWRRDWRACWSRWRPATRCWCCSIRA